MFLLDTNILSAFFEQDINVANQISKYPDDKIVTSVFCVSEIRYGIKKRAPGKKQVALEIFFAELFETAHIISFDSKEMEIFTTTKVKMESKGLSIEDFDLLIAATAIAHDCTLVTRNLKHFQNIENLITATW